MSSGNVAVTNKGEEPFVGRFDGISYAFEPGKTTVIPELAATFLFGYGLPSRDRGRVFQRNGWMTTTDPKSDFGPVAAVKRLSSFAFAEAAEDPQPEKPKAIVLPPPRIVSKNPAKVTVTMASGINLPGRDTPLAPSSPA